MSCGGFGCDGLDSEIRATTSKESPRSLLQSQRCHRPIRIRLRSPFEQALDVTERETGPAGGRWLSLRDSKMDTAVARSDRQPRVIGSAWAG